MTRSEKVQIKRMFVTTGRDLRTEALIFAGMVGKEVGALLLEFLKGVWEGLGLTGPQKPTRRRRGRSC